MSEAETTPVFKHLLQRAMTLSDTSSVESRMKIYDLMRASFRQVMRSADPPPLPEVIASEFRVLEQVIDQFELEYSQSQAELPVAEPEEPDAAPAPPRAADEGPTHEAVSQPDLEIIHSQPETAGVTVRSRLGAMVAAGATVTSSAVSHFAEGGFGMVKSLLRPSFASNDPTLPAILEFQRPSVAVLNAPMPLVASSMIWIISTMLVTLIALSGFVSVDQVVSVRGVVVSRTANLLIQPLETAIVKSIDVNEGDVVKAGQVLAHLDPTFVAADAHSMASQVESLSAEVARLRAQASGKPFTYSGDDPDWLLQLSIYGHQQSEFQFKLDGYEHKLDELNATIAKAESDIDGYTKRETMARNVEGIHRKLEEMQLGSKLSTLAASDAHVEIQRSLQSAASQLQSAQRDKQALQSERDSFVQNWSADVAQKLSDAMRKLNEAKDQMKKADRREALIELRADQDGIVQSFAKVSIGSVLQSGQPFITIVPSGAELEVEVNVPGAENGFVHRDNPVSIKFDTFPFSQYGLAEGYVRSLSPNSFNAQDEVRNPTGRTPTSSSNELYYRARVSLDHIGLHDTPAGFHIIPGMPVTADIKVGRRTVLGYFLGRVLPVVQEGLREPQS